METRAAPLFVDNCIPVEREPMWDGNLDISCITKQTDTLSENQCGMETVDRGLKTIFKVLVEREPMWDGNLRTSG
mgnify:CR=1 FL=1